MSNQTKKPPMGGMGPGKGPMTMEKAKDFKGCLLYTSPSPRDRG